MKRITLLMTFMFASLSLAAQTALVGMTTGHNPSSLGSIFGIAPGATTLQQQHLLSYDTPGANPGNSHLIEAANGKLYGVTGGGVFEDGVIFEYDYTTNVYLCKMNFNSLNGDGIGPCGSLVEVANGILYGMTSMGGTNSAGVIFEFDYTTNTFTKKFDFDPNTGGYPQGSLLKATNGKLYGLTMYGGGNGAGVIFEYDYTANTFTKKIDLDGSLGSNPRGALMQAANGKLYGMTHSGGTNGKGVIFEYDHLTNTYTKKVDLNISIGSNPQGSLMQAANGKLYGMTGSGGGFDKGVIFEYDYLTNVYTKKSEFNMNNGASPQGSLMQAANGKIYGMTSFGGSNWAGVFFDYDYVANVYDVKLNFDMSNGERPIGSMMLAANGKLYGMTMYGGANGDGVIFEFDCTLNTFTKTIDFNTSAGRNPYGSLLQVANGEIYGMTRYGGDNNKGVIFKYDYSINTYTKQVDLSLINGAWPTGSLMSATNGKLYGMTKYGGMYSKGVIFEYDYTTNQYNKIWNFDGSNGASPYGSLMQASNGKLYGMTLEGGVNGLGVIFEYDYTTSTFNKKVDFNGNNGQSPFGSLIQALNGKLYGMTNTGGANNKGVIFEFDYTTDTYVKKIDLDSINGYFPTGSLIEASNGKLYGMTSWGGIYQGGVIFEYEYSTNTYIKKVEFNGSNGGGPHGSLLQATNGSLYGMTLYGGANNNGVLFEFNYTTNTLSKKLDFATPVGHLYYLGHLIEINIPSATQEITDAMETTVYPNPAIQKATVRFKALRSGRAEIRVMDLAGRIVIKSRMNAIRGVNSTELNLIPCNPGLYLLQITDAGGNTSVKRLAVE